MQLEILFFVLHIVKVLSGSTLKNQDGRYCNFCVRCHQRRHNWSDAERNEIGTEF